MAGNKRLLIFRDKICTDQKYTQKAKWKRSTKVIFLEFSGMKWNIFYNFKVKCCRPLIVCLEVPNVYPPIVVVQINSYSKVNKIHAAHFWVCMLATVGTFITARLGPTFEWVPLPFSSIMRCDLCRQGGWLPCRYLLLQSMDKNAIGYIICDPNASRRDGESVLSQVFPVQYCWSNAP
jgi:hypothetical protein